MNELEQRIATGEASEADKKEYQKQAAIDNHDRWFKILDTTISEFESGDIDQEDFKEAVKMIADGLRESREILGKYAL